MTDDGTPQAVSRPELERLEARRRPSAPAAILQPALGGAQLVRAEAAQQQDARIREIRTRLDAAAGRAVRDFALGGTRQKAKSDFDRSR